MIPELVKLIPKVIERLDRIEILIQTPKGWLTLNRPVTIRVWGPGHYAVLWIRENSGVQNKRGNYYLNLHGLIGLSCLESNGLQQRKN